jgi:predicted metal-dependent peptidase
MEKFDQHTLAIVRRLQKARLSLLQKHPFYAILLMYMKFSLDLSCETAYTDGDRIAFNPDFLNGLGDRELEFVLMHEVLHTALGHPFRKQQDYNQDAFNIACDIVVNSNILTSCRYESNFSLGKYGEVMHLAPDGKEGVHYTVEQLYVQVRKALAQQKRKGKSGAGSGMGAGTGESATKGGGFGDGDGASDNPEPKDKDNPTLEELNRLIASLLKNKGGVGSGKGKAEKTKQQTQKPLDDHSFWQGDDEISGQKDIWLQRMINATQILGGEDGSCGCGSIPLAAQRLVQEITKPLLDWRTILNDFIQEEICDYSFAPPDKRMEDSPFFLPDFNEKDEKVKDILFMIDTSGSMLDNEITQCYSEIYGAIGQFNGKLQGKLGFFDAEVVEPVPFEDEEEFKIIRPQGGGGTSFGAIFDYVEKRMTDDPPVSIVILTDGGAPWPPETAAMGIPVLWIINNQEITPPWGKVARLIEK